MPTISVIIPAYNAESTIKETIDSILNQTFTDFELIVINDGSQDSTLEVVSSISDSRIRVFSFSNAGVSAARNRGIGEAKGKYFSFIDADDLWTPDKLEAQLAALQANPQAAVAYSWTDWVDESGQFLRPGSHSKSHGNVLSELLFRDFIASGSNPLIRKEALTQVGGFDESLTPAADWEMWLRLAGKYEFVNVPSAQILYRVSPNSMSANIWRMEAESLEIIDRVFAQGAESLQNLKKQVLGERYKYLTLKAVEGKLERKRGLSAARFFLHAIRYDPSWLTRTKLMLILILKISLATFLPPQQAKQFLNQVQKLSKSN
ncbi:MAG: glycosyltransferase [Symploca sp. SIO2D2]|nr:glycosyltransferase [Symploca sp. SIO2D2]